MPKYSNLQAFAAELIGTFLMVLFGNASICNALLAGTKAHGTGFLLIACGYGGGVFIAVQVVGHISGYVNPAVALGAAVIGDITWKRMSIIWAAEMLGAMIAALVVYMTYYPHLQGLELLNGLEKSDCSCCTLEDANVAVVAHHISKKSKRIASTRNRHLGKGQRVRVPITDASSDPFTKLTQKVSGKKENNKAKENELVLNDLHNHVKVKSLAEACRPELKHLVEEYQELQLVTFVTRPSTVHRYWLFATFEEFMGTVVLTFVALSFSNRAHHFLDESNHSLYQTGMDAMLVGVLVFLCIACLGGITGPALNPARDLGPRIVFWLLPISGKGSSEWWYSWVPVVGPLLGGVVGALLSLLMKTMTEDFIIKN